jgi:putative endonuclease
MKPTSSKPNKRAALGRQGEDLAVEHLRKAGYHIVERNVRTRFGEIDIVAEDQGCLVFVEVRTMASNLMVPEESVTWRKQRRMASLGMRYIQEHGKDDAEWRADVVAIEVGADGEPTRLEHYINAVEG